MLRHALIWSTLLAVALFSPTSEAQLAPTGTHYAGRTSDTGYTQPNENGGYTATVPLDLPQARGGLPVPLQIVSGTRGFGAAGLGWDIPLSYVYVDHTFAHRRPARTSTNGVAARERVTVALLGRSIEMLVQGDHWIARNDPSMTMRASDGRWQVVDANGISYTFVKYAQLYATGGPGIADPGGLWLLAYVEGKRGAKVQLDYAISTVDAPPAADPLITIDLAHIQYNPDSSNTCFKHDIGLIYQPNEPGGAAQAFAILGERVIARYHKLGSIVVRSRSSCTDTPVQLRSYELTYATDQDTQLQRLSTVLEHGRGDMPDETLPIATYHYGTASTLVGGKAQLLYGAAQTTALPVGTAVAVRDNGPTAVVAMTDKVSTSLFQAPTDGTAYGARQTFQDFNGDGRADLVYTTEDGTLEIANGQGTFGFGPAVRLTDNSLTRNVIDTHSSSADRFTTETSKEDRLQDYVWTQSIDFNGDGRIDILDAAEKPDTWVAYLNMPDSGPSGVVWVRRELPVKELRKTLEGHGLKMPKDYLPLSSRRTGRDIDYMFHWIWSGGHYVRPIQLVGPPGNQTAIPEPPQPIHYYDEHTYTEFKLTDINGDGYPDVVFDTAPVVSSPVVDSTAPYCGRPDCDSYQPQIITFAPFGNTLAVAYNTAGLFLDSTASANPFADEINIVGGNGCSVELWSSAQTSGDRAQYEGCMFVDLNGDGLPDRIDGWGQGHVWLGTGFSFQPAPFNLPASAVRLFAAQESQYVDQCPGTHEFPVGQDMALRDVTGDGIPDLIQHHDQRSPVEGIRVFVGTGAGFADTAIPIELDGITGLLTQFASWGQDRCDGNSFWTLGGVYDANGDGRADLVSVSGSTMFVRQLAGGAEAGSPEAGRLIGIDNGYGASIQISYTSAKHDTTTAHAVPFPEIVVSSIKTTGTYGLGGTLAATNYAYGKIGMFYDSVLDGFRSLGYERRVAVTMTGTAKDGSPVASATITDAYPLEHDTAATFYYLSEEQRIGRYLQAGRVSDTTNLAGEIGTDPWTLLTVDIAADTRRIAGTHYSIDIGDTQKSYDATSPSGEACVDVAFPYDYYTSKRLNSYNPCSTRAFLYTRSTQSWRGSEAPPSEKNVQVSTSVRSVDDFGRITSIIYQNDATQDDDDVCVDTTYANPPDPILHVLTAPASRKVWACGAKEDGHTVAEESWEYDNVTGGLPTSHTVYRHATDTGALLSVSTEYDAEYDTLGNPAKVTSTRDDTAWRSTTIAYDIFGVASTDVSVVGSDATVRHVSQAIDPISGALLASTDENATTHGFTWDALGRPLTTTVKRPDDNEPGILSVHSYDGFTGPDVPYGRSVKITTYADPLAPSDTTTIGHESTTHFDELGREVSTEVDLGGDYNDTLIVGRRAYDQVGRVVFEADAYPKTQDAATAYGTSRIFNDDGSLFAEIRGRGPQVYSLYPDPSTEFYPTLYWHQFDHHVETTGIKEADALTAGAPQEGVTRQATSTAIGRVLARSTYQNNTRIENATFSYDLLGNQTSIARYLDPVNAALPVMWLWQFDSLGQVTSLSEPTNATQTRAYDSWGELKTVEWHPATEPVHGIQITYDSLGRTLASYEENNHVLDPLTVNTYAYDSPGASARITPLNVKGRLAMASSPTEDIVLGYDGLGHVNARSFTDLNNVEYVEEQGVHADGSQAFIQLRLPDDGYAAERVDYAYDSASRLRWMWSSDGVNTQDLYVASTLDAFGRLRKGSFGPTTYDAKYADTGRRLPQSVTVSSSSESRNISFGVFDAAGRELTRTETAPASSAGTTGSIYDALGRLSGSVKNPFTPTQQTWKFAYDPLGNVTQLYGPIATPVTMKYLSTDRDKICAVAYVGSPPPFCNTKYDSFGNVVSEPTRTGNNTLSYFNSGDARTITNSAGATATFAYDPFGDVQDLSITSSAGQLRHDRHFGDLITLRSQNAQSPSTSFISRQFPGPGMTISRRGSQGAWVFQFSEARGTRFTTDENGKFVQDVSYTPYGDAASSGVAAGTSTFTTDQWNAGDALDGFGLVQLGKRIYDPNIGRFLSRDPLLIPRTAATTNPYAFAINDPLNLSDPSGMAPCAGCGISAGNGTNGDDAVEAAIATAISTIAYLFTTQSHPATSVSARPPGGSNSYTTTFPAMRDQRSPISYFSARAGEAFDRYMASRQHVRKSSDDAIRSEGLILDHLAGLALGAFLQDVVPSFDFFNALDDSPGATRSAPVEVDTRSLEQQFKDAADNLDSFALSVGPVGGRWAPVDINLDVCRVGCEDVAQEIQSQIGGKVYRITNRLDPKAALGGYRGKNWSWFYHDVVVKDGVVFDLTTGSSGLPIDEFKKLWQYPDALDFGF